MGCSNGRPLWVHDAENAGDELAEPGRQCADAEVKIVEFTGALIDDDTAQGGMNQAALYADLKRRCIVVCVASRDRSPSPLLT